MMEGHEVPQQEVRTWIAEAGGTTIDVIDWRDLLEPHGLGVHEFGALRRFYFVTK